MSQSALTSRLLCPYSSWIAINACSASGVNCCSQYATSLLSQGRQYSFHTERLAPPHSVKLQSPHPDASTVHPINAGTVGRQLRKDRTIRLFGLAEVFQSRTQGSPSKLNHINSPGITQFHAKQPTRLVGHWWCGDTLNTFQKGFTQRSHSQSHLHQESPFDSLVG